MKCSFCRWHARGIAVLAVVFFTSVPLRYSAEPLPRAGAESATVPEGASAAGAASARSGKFFGARFSCVADPGPAERAVKGKSPAPIIVIPGPNGLTIASEDLEALDEFERLLTAATDRSCRCGKRGKSFRRGNRGGVWRPIFKQQRAIGRPRRASADSSTAARPRG